MKSKERTGKNPGAKNPFGHYRKSPTAADLVKRGDEIVLGGPSNNTLSAQQADYRALLWAVRELGQYVDQKREKHEEPTISAVKQDFQGQAVLVGDGKHPGYATDTDLAEFISQPMAPGKFAKILMARRWGQQPNTIETNVKPGRKTAKIVPRRTP